MRSQLGTIDVRAPAGAWLVLALAMGAPAAAADPIPGTADPRTAAPREILSAPHEFEIVLPERACGMGTITADGRAIEVPRQGRFTQVCVTVTIVDASDRVVTTGGRRCQPPVFKSC
jgi:hypothetical protein